MSIEFIAPDFIDGNDPESIQARMMKSLPADIDNMPGGFPYDFTMPTAIEKSELIQFHLVRTLMLMFPMWSWGEWLDLHGKAVNIARREANRASGFITVIGNAGTFLPKGTLFATPTYNSMPSLEYASDEDAQIGDDGTVKVHATAALAGRASNVSAFTVNLMSKPVAGVKSVTNEEEMTGGTEDEDDESLSERIIEAYQLNDGSFVGNNSDYKRWAKEVSGVGQVVVHETWDGPNTVKLAILDANGEPANEAICMAVYEHIVSQKDPDKRLLPIGAKLTVVPVSAKKLTYKISGVQLENGYSADTAEELFKAAIQDYYLECKRSNSLVYNKARAVFTTVAGVKDFTEFVVNEGMSNITFEIEEYPVTDAVNIAVKEAG